MKVKRYRTFGTVEASGDLAIVVSGEEIAHWTIDDRQLFTTRQHVSAVVFVDTRESLNAWSLDFFYPHARSPLCLHAALAAADHIEESGKSTGVTPSITTAYGRLSLSFDKNADETTILLYSPPTVRQVFDKADIAKLLDCKAELLVRSPCSVSAGSKKVLVEIVDVASLYALQPKLGSILQWSTQTGAIGIYAYVSAGNGLYEGRNFNHQTESSEDAATGVAAGALAKLFKSRITLKQGSHLGNPCMMKAEYDGNQIRVGGRVIRSP